MNVYLYQNWTEKELKNAYIGNNKRWPDADTLAYRPFAEDINDYSWNNNNLTANGNDYSFTTNSQWLKCCALNPSDSNWTYFTTSLYSSINFANNNYSFACDICDFSPTLIWSYTLAAGFGLWPHIKFPMINTYQSGNLWKYGWVEFAASSMTWVDWWLQTVDFTISTFTNVIYTWNYSTWVLRIYINWEYKWKFNCSWTFTAPSAWWICSDPYSYATARCIHWKIKDFVIEHKTWTDDEALDYYNSTR